MSFQQVLLQIIVEATSVSHINLGFVLRVTFAA